MKEYKILRDTDSEITKKLNQWRHDFHIEIISMCMDNRVHYKWIPSDDKQRGEVVLQTVAKPWGNLVVMLTREKKENLVPLDLRGKGGPI